MSGHSRRTFADYQRQVLHALGNPDEADLDIGPGAIVNDALEHIAAMHEWTWAGSGQVSLDVTAEQDYVELPADFGTLLGIEHDQSWAAQMIPVTWADLIQLRTYPIVSWTQGYFFTIQTGNVEQGEEDAGLSLPTLALYPTPAEDRADALQLAYRRFIRRLENDDDRPQIPSYMDRPLSLLARAFASTDYDDDPQSAYSAEFQSLIEGAIERDGLAVHSFGIPRGAAQGPKRLTPFGYPDHGIPNPTMPS